MQKCRPRFSDLKPYSGSVRGSVFLTPKLSLSPDCLSNVDPRLDLKPLMVSDKSFPLLWPQFPRPTPSLEPLVGLSVWGNGLSCLYSWPGPSQLWRWGLQNLKDV